MKNILITLIMCTGFTQVALAKLPGVADTTKKSSKKVIIKAQSDWDKCMGEIGWPEECYSRLSGQKPVVKNGIKTAAFDFDKCLKNTGGWYEECYSRSFEARPNIKQNIPDIVELEVEPESSSM